MSSTIGTADIVSLVRNAFETFPEPVTFSQAVRNADGTAKDMIVRFINTQAQLDLTSRNKNQSRNNDKDQVEVTNKLWRELWPETATNGTLQHLLEILNTDDRGSRSLSWMHVHPEDTESSSPYYLATRIDKDTLLCITQPSPDSLSIQVSRDQPDSEPDAEPDAEPDSKVEATEDTAIDQDQYQTLLTALSEGIVVQAADQSIITANESAQRLLGITSKKEPFNISSLFQTFDEDGHILNSDEFPSTKALRTGEAELAKIIGISNDNKDEIRWVSVNSHPIFRVGEARPYGVVSSLSDITDRKALEDELSFITLHDPLTGLPNRTLLFDRIDQALRRSRRHGGVDRVAVLLLDLDGFKKINDRLGHEAGDTVLKEVASRLMVTIRDQDSIARLAGDEFAILLEDVDIEMDGLGAFVKRVREVIIQPISYEDSTGKIYEVKVSASIGAARAHPRESLHQLLGRADRDMHHHGRRR